MDGSAKGNPGRAGCGGVLRYHNSRLVDVVVVTISSSTSDKMEEFMVLFIVKTKVFTSLFMVGRGFFEYFQHAK